MRAHVECVEYASTATVDDLVAPETVDSIFTGAEQAHCRTGHGSDRWAGRLAAKRAVAGVLGLAGSPADLFAIEVLPGEHDPSLPVTGLCRLGHRPRVVLHSHVADHAATLGLASPDVAVSISHDGGLAAAVAALSAAAPATAST